MTSSGFLGAHYNERTYGKKQFRSRTDSEPVQALVWPFRRKLSSSTFSPKRSLLFYCRLCANGPTSASSNATLVVHKLSRPARPTAVESGGVPVVPETRLRKAQRCRNCGCPSLLHRCRPRCCLAHGTAGTSLLVGWSSQGPEPTVTSLEHWRRREGGTVGQRGKGGADGDCVYT